MCDYSLQYVASRPAKVDDKLVSARFSTSTTRGFAAIGEPDIAVCLLPGTEVAFEEEVKYRYGWSATRDREPAEKVARFRHIDKDKPDAHHDALEFPNGQVLLVNDLCEGQQVAVLQLPVSQSATSELDGEQRAFIVA